MITSLFVVLAALSSAEEPTSPVDETIAYLTEQAPVTCSRVDAFFYATGHAPDVDVSVQRFVDAWVDVPNVDTYALFYEGIVVGCITAAEADQLLIGR